LRALQGDLLATTSVIASSVVADIDTLASNLGVFARVGKVGGLRVAFVLGASAVVVTEVSRESSVVARVSAGCSLRVAGIDGTGVVVVASLGDILLYKFADGGLVILLVRPEARVVSASVLIVTVSIDGAGRGRALKIGVVDGTSIFVAFVLVAFVGGRDGGFLLSATSLLVASELDTFVGVTLGAVGTVLLDEASGRVARVLVASIRGRDRDVCVNASELRVARSLLTLVGLVTNAVRGSEGNGTSGRVALVDSACSGSRYGDIRVDASFLYVTSDRLAFVGGVASGSVLVNGTSGRVANKGLASIGGRDSDGILYATTSLGTSVRVALAGIVGTTSGNSRFNLSCGRVANVLLASIRGRNRYISVDASDFRVARGDLAKIGVVSNALRDSTVNSASLGVASVLHTPVRRRNISGGEDASLGTITRVVLAHVGVVGKTVRGGVANYASLGVTSILVAHVRGRNWVLGGGTALDGVALVGVAKIRLVLRADIVRERSVYADVLGRIGRINLATISSTQALVIARCLVGGIAKNAGHKEGSLDGTSRRLASEGSALGVGRDRLSNMSTSCNGVASIVVALVTELAESTNISGGDGTSGRIARISSTFSVGRDRVGNMRATGLGVTSISVTLVSLLAESTDIS
jgi:hypothetical protein